MKNQTRLALAASISAVLLAAQAQAEPNPNPGPQDSAATPPTAATETLEAVVVTGTRIVRESGFDYPVPVAVIGGEALAASGFTVLGDAIGNLPQALVSTNIQNTSGTLFNAGQSRVDLRALGSARTLVLVDGRRHLTGDFRTSAVDLNMIPSTMIDRIEAISGGASAVYGSEAIAGVVNIILKTRLDGFELDFQGGQTGESDGEEWKAAAAWGASFADGRGNFLIGAEAGEVRPIFQIDRDWAFPGIRRDNLVTPQTVVPASRSNTMPTATFQLVNSTNPVTARSVSIALDRSALNVNTSECRTPTVRPACQDPWLFWGATYNALQGDLERQSSRAYLDFELTDGLTAYGDVSYSRNRGFAIFQPAFSNAAGGGTMPVVLRGDNAFLAGNSALAQQLRTQWTAAGLAFTQAASANVGKFWAEFGNRDTEVFRAQTRAIAGLKGRFGAFDRDFTWDAYAQYSRLQGYALAFNVPNVRRVQNATDAVLVGGQIVCRNEAARAEGCVPWDLLAGPSAAAIAYTNANARSDGEATQRVAAANVSTTLFALPAGDVGIAGGVEYRKETSDQIQDPLSASGALFYNAIGRTRGAYDITEGYVEVAIPVLKDLPFAHRVGIEGAYRVGDYSTVGNVSQWRVGADWAPFTDLRFRASRAASVRAPNITELFAPQGRNFTTAANDPCDRGQIGALGASDPRRAIRIANCSAVIPGYNPATFESNFGTGRPSLPLLQGGNPDLTEETANTLTAGVVLQPRWVPDLQVSFDYWQIEVDDAVNTIPINTLLQNLCYDVEQSPAASNRFCELIRRDPTGATTGGRLGGVTEIVLTNQNVQAIETSGFDVALSYDFTIGEIGRLSFQADATRIHRWDLQGVPGGPVTRFAGILTGGTPKWKGAGTIGWTMDRFAISWQSRYQSSMGVSETDAPSSRDPFYTGVYWDHDVRAQYELTEALTLRAGIINVTDEIPPQLPESFAGTGTASSGYDNRGRWFYLGANYAFGTGTR